MNMADGYKMQNTNGTSLWDDGWRSKMVDYVVWMDRMDCERVQVESHVTTHKPRWPPGSGLKNLSENIR